MRRDMRSHLPLALLLCAAFAAAPSHAQDRRYVYEAELAAAAKSANARAGGVDWTCTGTHCTTEARGGVVSVRGCSELARALGPVTRYASELRQLGEKELAECNQTVAAAPAKAPALAPKAAAGRTVTPELTYTGAWPGGRETGAKQ
jgi:hypothetical protein